LGGFEVAVELDELGEEREDESEGDLVDDVSYDSLKLVG
jgi:hypothetical protein